MEETKVILVDELDNALGTVGKMEAHEKGLLHRAFSIFIFNSKGEMLLQQRAMKKYHSKGLWSNSCCSHPLPGENILVTARRRLLEEMGFNTSLEKIFDFIYRTELENGLTEYEFDHVFVGEYDGEVPFNKNEVMDHKYREIGEIRKSLEKNPENYTSWFQLAFPRVEEWWNHRYRDKVA